MASEAGIGYNQDVITSDLVGLRARSESDVPILHEELYSDVVTRTRGDTRPWRPIDLSSGASPYAVVVPDDKEAVFSVVELSTGELAGEAIVWSIDLYNRSAHLGLTLRPRFRGRGLGTDTVRALCRYAFDALGMHRLQIETLSDNHGMINAAKRAGFAMEGTMREDAWVLGEFLDDVVFGLLERDYRQLVPQKPAE
jgi:RimJ/RimL family protein N-acetyltransferase